MTSLALRAAAVALAAATMCASAQPRADDYGGLASYRVPAEAGAGPEFDYCVLYAKRAWRMATMVDERSVTLQQVKAFAEANLGRTAAIDEIADYERLERKEFESPNAMAAERFMRCATRLKLNPQPRHRGNVESCFRSLVPLDQAARMRADGKSAVQAQASLNARHPALDKGLVESTVRLAYTGPSIAEQSALIENTFAACFERAGEAQAQAKR